MKFNVTLVQVSCKEGMREENFNRVRKLLEQKPPMDGVGFIVLPELFAIGFGQGPESKAFADVLLILRVDVVQVGNVGCYRHSGVGY